MKKKNYCEVRWIEKGRFHVVCGANLPCPNPNHNRQEKKMEVSDLTQK